MKTASKKAIVSIAIFLFMAAGLSAGEGRSNTDFGGNTLYVGGSGEGNYTTIQEAINSAVEGDTVFVYDDSSPYHETITVDKSITITGENRNTTVVDGGTSGTVISIDAGHVTVSGFTVRSAGGTGLTGMEINSGNARISDIAVSEYSFGINVCSDRNIISGVEITDCSIGIFLQYIASSNVISGSTISRSNEGIQFEGSENNLVIYSNISGNNEGIWMDSGHGNSIVSNNIDHVTLWHSRDTWVENNNFVGDSDHATFFFSLQESPFSRNHWSGNYWGGGGSLPKLIVGRWWIFPWLNFDLHPAGRPYEIVKNPLVIMNTSMGIMMIELYEDKMPITSENFEKLVKSGFYNGLVFHRVIDDFVIQGGGYYPDGTYRESPYGTIPLETSQDVQHVDGAISMARTNDPDSATSQFFICDGDQHYLDGQYAAFGKVVEGMDVLRAIASVETTTKHGMQDWPVNEVIMGDVTLLD